MPPIQHRQRALHRLGPRPDAIEVDELAVEGRLVAGPDLAHGQRALAHDAKAGGRIGPVVAHLLEVPAGADAELEAPAGEVVERGGLVGQGDRVALDDQRDAGADPQALGGRRDRAQRHERIERVRVLARQLVAARPRALAAGGDVRVLGDEERLEAGVLGGAAERDGRDGLVGDEHRQAELHWATSGARSAAAVAAGAWSTCSVTCSMPKRSRTSVCSARRTPWQSSPGATSTCAASAGKPVVTSQTCRSWTSTTPGWRPGRGRRPRGRRPRARPRAARGRQSRSSRQPERSISAATNSAAIASARSKPVMRMIGAGDRGGDRREEVGEHVGAGALDVQRAALGPRQRHGGGDVRHGAEQADDDHDAALDVGRRDQGAGSPRPRCTPASTSSVAPLTWAREDLGAARGRT